MIVMTVWGAAAATPSLVSLQLPSLPCRHGGIAHNDAQAITAALEKHEVEAAAAAAGVAVERSDRSEL